MSGHLEASVYLFMERRKEKRSTYFLLLEIHQPTGAGSTKPSHIARFPGFLQGAGQSELRWPQGLLEVKLYTSP